MIHPPKLRPPRPHSSSESSDSARRQRLAANPRPLTSRNRTVKTTSSVTLTVHRRQPFVLRYTTTVHSTPTPITASWYQ